MGKNTKSTLLTSPPSPFGDGVKGVRRKRNFAITKYFLHLHHDTKLGRGI
jgi:hypothetical protein